MIVVLSGNQAIVSVWFLRVFLGTWREREEEYWAAVRREGGDIQLIYISWGNGIRKEPFLHINPNAVS